MQAVLAAWQHQAEARLDARRYVAEHAHIDANAPELADLLSDSEIPEGIPELICCEPAEKMVVFRLPSGACVGVGLKRDGGVYSHDRNLLCDWWHKQEECADVVVNNSSRDR